MVRQCARLIFLVVPLAALPVSGRAQGSKALLNTVAHAMGAEGLTTLQYSGSGSSYDEKGQHTVMSSYSQKMDLNAMTSSIQMVLMQGTPPAPHSMNQAVAAGTPWNIQLDFWITPYAFLKGALAHDAVVEAKTVEGEPFRVVTFTLPGGHKVVGYINAENMVERVEVSDDKNVLIRSIYHDYMDFKGLKVPTIMVRKRAGALSRVLIVKDVER